MIKTSEKSLNQILDEMNEEFGPGIYQTGPFMKYIELKAKIRYILDRMKGSADKPKFDWIIKEFEGVE